MWTPERRGGLPINFSVILSHAPADGTSRRDNDRRRSSRTARDGRPSFNVLQNHRGGDGRVVDRAVHHPRDAPRFFERPQRDGRDSFLRKPVRIQGRSDRPYRRDPSQSGALHVPCFAKWRYLRCRHRNAGIVAIPLPFDGLLTSISWDSSRVPAGTRISASGVLNLSVRER
jgi:hypothetical protein